MDSQTDSLQDTFDNQISELPMSEEQLKAVIEAVLFVSDTPIQVSQIQRAFPDMASSKIKECISQLRTEYEQISRGIRIMSVAGGYQMNTPVELAPFISKIFQIKKVRKLSIATVETLAIIAYKQPVTKMEVEAIRGVDVGYVVKGLLDRKLVKITGRKDAPGRPFIYGTTPFFLEYFGLNSLKDLPPIEELEDLRDGLERVKKEDNAD